MLHSPSGHEQGELALGNPEAPTSPRRQSTSAFSRPSTPNHCPVLIVEDDSDLREMMAQLLTLEGFHSVAVANGKEALRYLSAGDTPNVILLDLMMPVMDGWEFRRVQQADPVLSRVPTIVITAVPERVKNLNPDGLLKKPLNFDELIRLVRKYCD